MKKQNKDLITVAHYARKINKSVQWVYQLIKSGDVKSEVIDGKIFVKCS